MANDIVPNDIYSERAKLNELIYFSAIICETLRDLEAPLREIFKDDVRVKILLKIKENWLRVFNALNK